MLMVFCTRQVAAVEVEAAAREAIVYGVEKGVRILNVTTKRLRVSVNRVGAV